VKRLLVSVMAGRLAVCRLPGDAAVPDWVRGSFTCVTRTADELSIVCDDDAVPAGVQAERGWRAFKVAGPIAFELTGVAASLLTPLAEANISVFPMATFDTDYLLVKEDALLRASDALRTAGHEVF
jgi:hypothetical protein